MDYESSLDRALEAVPSRGSDERLSVPDATVQPDGAFVRLTNLSAIADALDREPEHVHRYVQQNLGTSGQFQEGRGRYSGRFSADDFDSAIESYVDEYVVCSECGLPDTRLVTEDRTQMLRCTACGAFRPVSKRKTSPSRQEPREAIEEGKTYQLEITGTGRKGDGVAQKGDYTVFVPGAEEGDTVQVLIENVSGNLAFSRRVS